MRIGSRFNSFFLKSFGDTLSVVGGIGTNSCSSNFLAGVSSSRLEVCPHKLQTSKADGGRVFSRPSLEHILEEEKESRNTCSSMCNPLLSDSIVGPSLILASS